MLKLQHQVPSVVALIMRSQIRKADKIISQYDICNKRGEFLTARAIVFDTLKINGFAGENENKIATFGISFGFYVWALHLSCVLTGVQLGDLEAFADDACLALREGKYTIAQTQIASDLRCAIGRVRVSQAPKSTLAIFLELTWAVWSHEIAHVISGHARMICEDGIARFLREFRGMDELTDILAVTDYKIIEGEADCRSASLRTAELLDQMTERGQATNYLVENLAAFILANLVFFTLIFSTRGRKFVGESAYPTPLTRLAYIWGTINSTLTINGVETKIAEEALERALLEFKKFEAFVPDLSSLRELEQVLQDGLKEEIWDIGSQSIARHEHFAMYIFGSSSFELVESPFD